MDVVEEEQRFEILDRMAVLAVDPMCLWLHFVSLGGNASYVQVLGYLQDDGPMPQWDRTVLGAAARDLSL